VGAFLSGEFGKLILMRMESHVLGFVVNKFFGSVST